MAQNPPPYPRTLRGGALTVPGAPRARGAGWPAGILAVAGRLPSPRTGLTSLCSWKSGV